MRTLQVTIMDVDKEKDLVMPVQVDEEGDLDVEDAVWLLTDKVRVAEVADMEVMGMVEVMDKVRVIVGAAQALVRKMFLRGIPCKISAGRQAKKLCGKSYSCPCSPT